MCSADLRQNFGANLVVAKSSQDHMFPNKSYMPSCIRQKPSGSWGPAAGHGDYHPLHT